MDIFIDVLIMENLVMNYIILAITSKFARIKASSLRLFLGALVGTAYVVIMVLAPDIKVYYTLFAKFILSLAIIAVAFSPEKLMDFLKILVTFYASTFIFAGASFAFMYFGNTGGYVRNGIMYILWQSKGSALVFSVLTALIILRVFYGIVQFRLSKDKLIRSLVISFENRVAGMPALVDTGNSLHDPLSNMPVIIVEFRAIKDILPDEISNIFNRGDENLEGLTEMLFDSPWLSRLRLIPFNSIGRENGILIGFKPDYIEIWDKNNKKGVNNVIVGISNKNLSGGKEYNALLSPELAL